MRISDWSSDVCSSDLINDIRLEPAELLSFADALPTIEHEIIEEPDEKDKIRSVYRQKLDGDGNPVHNAEAVEYKNRMITDVREIKLQLPSLAQIILAFGPGRPAERPERRRRGKVGINTRRSR